jgi:hypothetical protein
VGADGGKVKRGSEEGEGNEKIQNHWREKTS